MAPTPKSGIQISLIVKSYDEAITFFVDKLGFQLLEDRPAYTTIGNRPKRWVVISPSEGPDGCRILLAQADGAEQEAAIGKQWAGRVGMFWYVSDFEAAFQRVRGTGTQILESPRDEGYGRVVVFCDLWGNKWDLIGPVPGGSS